jgi:hypothetical protein
MEGRREGGMEGKEREGREEGRRQGTGREKQERNRRDRGMTERKHKILIHPSILNMFGSWYRRWRRQTYPEHNSENILGVI